MKSCCHMGIRRFTAQDFPLLIELQDKARDSIIANCLKAQNRETGSILVGSYSDDGTTVNIEEAFSPPPDSVGTVSTFFRGTSGISKKLDLRWSDASTHYVGEWHFHPRGTGQPSNRDNKQMIQLAVNAAVQCRIPVLMIVFSPTPEEFDFRAFVFTDDGSRYSLDCLPEAESK